MQHNTGQMLPVSTEGGVLGVNDEQRNNLLPINSILALQLLNQQNTPKTIMNKVQ